MVCLGSCSSAYYNGYLPDSGFAGPTAFAYWDDLYILSGTNQTIRYGTSGVAPNRILTVEFLTCHFGIYNLIYQFQVIFYENAPGIVKYAYIQTGDNGTSATVGTQGISVFLYGSSITIQ